MPPMTPFSALRSLPIRARPVTALRPGIQRLAVLRSFADHPATNNHNVLPKAETQGQDAGPNMQQQEHVSEEAAKMAQATGGEGPDLSQGTPVQEILADEKEQLENAPKVMKESVADGTGAANAKPNLDRRSFSTMARRLQDDLSMSADPSALDPSMIPSASQRALYTAAPTPPILGHKFPLPALPLPPRSNQEYRHDPVITQITNLLMQDGKKATAQRNMSHILTVLRTSPVPTYSAQRNLLPGAPPASHLPLNPVLYLTLAIDSIAPLLRIRSQRGAAGGGVALQIPVPLGLRQRRRQSMMWILDVVSKKKSRSSGPNTFAQRVAEELIAIVEGRSGVWTRRDAVHKLATTARSNLSWGNKGRR